MNAGFQVNPAFALFRQAEHNALMADTVQQVKDKLSIVDVVSQYVKLERSGSALRARCPFHAEKTPSFFVSPDRGTYHCFGCNVGGDIFSFVEQIEGLDFKGALKILAEKAGVPLVFEKKGERDERDRLFELMEAATIFYTSRLSDDAIKYLKQRGISEPTIKAFRVGLSSDKWTDLVDQLKSKKFSDKEMLDAGVAVRGERGLRDKFRNRIMFPLADSAGRIVGFSGRIFGEAASPEAPKYLNSPETPLYHKSRILYGFDQAKLPIRKLNCAVLVEGQLDLLASHQAGWGNTVAVSGTAFTKDHAALIRRMTDNLVIALDADEAGIKAASRAAREALRGGLNVKVARLPDGMDPADYLLKEGGEAWKKAIRDSKDIITFLLDVLEEHSKSPDAFRRAVESIVLPFLSDVQSPIAREQYQREIAKRLDVSESAIAEALKKLPENPDARVAQSAAPEKAKSSTRGKNAYALLLWQESLVKPGINPDAYTKELKDAIGVTAFEALDSLPAAEKESLRFSAERLYGNVASIEKETKHILRALLIERLSKELSDSTLALKKAEKAGDGEGLQKLMDVNKLLTTRIAQIHEKE